jgi:hypothetical protein
MEENDEELSRDHRMSNFSQIFSILFVFIVMLLLFVKIIFF